MPAVAPPLAVGLAVAFALGLVAGAAANWAAYWLAWNRRLISPWSPPPAEAPPRKLSDRLPVAGWWGLRRERAHHGGRFWLRPMLVELGLGVAWAGLYWHHVDQQRLILPQIETFLGAAMPLRQLATPFAALAPAFFAHAILISLMAAASLIDWDEKTIPDGITIPGTLMGLALATIWPMSLLPNVEESTAPPELGVLLPLVPGIQLARGDLYISPLTLTAPMRWPAALQGAPHWTSLAIAWSSYGLWIFALTPRHWRGNRGSIFALRLIAARVKRALLAPPLLPLAIVGFAAIGGVWWYGGAAWAGLLTALVGVVGSGGLIWAVRIAASAAMKREAMGFGDVTLMMMIGAFIGWQPAIAVFFLAPFAGLVAGILQLILRRDDVIPYGPYLCLGATAVILQWGRLWNDESTMRAAFEWPWLAPVVLGAGVLLLGAMLVIWRNIKEWLWGYE